MKPKRKTRKTKKKKVSVKRGGNMNLKDIITLWILSWKSPLTIKNTLESYKRHHLFNFVTPHIYFQERSETDNALAKEFGIEHVHGTDKNIGIMNAFYKMINDTTTPYFIFAECDFEVFGSEDKIKKVIEDSIKLMRQENVKMVYLRNEKNELARKHVPVENKYLANYDYKDYKFKLAATTFLDKPEEIIKDVYTIKNVPEYNYKWYVCKISDARWSNNIFIGDTRFLKDVIAPIIQAHMNEEKYATDPYASLENMLNEPQVISKISDYKVAAGDGIFIHKRFDR